jgi:nucleoside-diphosphate-sugar epimerase
VSQDLIAVTGAGGFIGSEVCRRLSDQRYVVRGLLGPPGSSQAVRENLAETARFEITDLERLVEFLSQVEAVVHLAGPPSVRSSFDEPTLFARTHVEGTAAVLEAARMNGVRRVVYVSSADVYGRTEADRVTEDDPLEARSPYAAAKIGAEQMVRAFSQAHGLEAFILRPFSVYGPGMSERSLVARILAQLASSSPVCVADLRPVRDYCFVADVARAIERAIAAPVKGVETVNVGSGIGTSVALLARTAIALSGNHRALCEDARGSRPREADILRLVADVSKAQALLDWAPSVPLATGLREMIGTGRS